MAVLPFTSRPTRVSRTTAAPVSVVRGSFAAPTGGTGSFRGDYRLEHLVARSGRLAARGVFTGRLSDGHGRRVGIAARRRTAPVALTALDGRVLVHLPALDVDLNGLVVTMEELDVEVGGTSAERAVRAALRLPPPEDDVSASCPR
jgi:hypothetical protein